MKWTIRVLLACAVIAAVFLLWRPAAGPQRQAADTGPSPTGDAGNAAAAARDPVLPQAPPDAPPASGVGPTRPDPGATRVQAPADVSHGPDPAPETGPIPLSQDDEQQLRTLLEQRMSPGDYAGELYELARNEAPDRDSERLEELIAATIRRHGGAQTGLRLSRPHCTRSVCTLMARGTATTSDPRADWQRLSASIMNQPWFREHFDDASTVVVPDAQGIAYLTFYVRCTPDACRFGTNPF